MKSKERYQARIYKKRFRDYMNNPESRTVFNLSSVELTIPEILVLELGYGFVPTPSNTNKEEEMLILEGFRFIDRLGKVDNSTNNTDVVSSGNNSTIDNNTFVRSTDIPQPLRFSQPSETNLSHNET